MRKPVLPLIALILLAACNQSAQDTASRVENIADRIEAEGDRLANTIDDAGAQIDEVGAAIENGTGRVITAVDGALDRPTDAWVGKWVGVEGLALDIAKADRPGTYRLRVSLMDGTNDYAGRADGNSIRFTRDGKEETIRATNGAGTGLKWLAEKQDCLVIKPGEGFCRG
jgi:hypothetical protein